MIVCVCSELYVKMHLVRDCASMESAGVTSIADRLYYVDGRKNRFAAFKS